VAQDKAYGCAWPEIWYSGASGAEPDAAAYAGYTAKGYKLLRIGFQWPHLQPTLFGAIDQTMFDKLARSTRNAAAAGCKVIWDCHSVGMQYNGMPVGTSGLPYTALRDFWAKLSAKAKADSSVWPYIWAFEIMNEPGQGCQANNPAGTWVGNHTVAGSGYLSGWQGVRDTDATMRVLLSGECYTGTAGWSRNGNMVMPDANSWLTGHVYLDRSGSGNYRANLNDVTVQPNPTSPTDEGMTSSLAQAKFDDWLNFMSSKGYKGVITEFNVPCKNGTDTSWIPILAACYSKMDAHPNCMGCTFWTGGTESFVGPPDYIYNGSQGVWYGDSGNAHWNVFANYPTGPTILSSGGGGGGLSNTAQAPLTSRAALRPIVPSTTTPLDLSIFTDQFDNGFGVFDTFNATTTAVASPSPAYEGANALQINFGAFGGAKINRAATFLSNASTEITFAAYCASSFTLGVTLIDSADVEQYGNRQDVVVPAGTWTVFHVPMANLTGGASWTLKGLVFSEQSGGARVVYIDHLGPASPGVSGLTANMAGVADLNPTGLPTLLTALASFNSVGNLAPQLGALADPPLSLSIFTDQFDNGFGVSSTFNAGTTATIVTASPPYEGSKSLAIDLTQYGGVFLTRGTAFPSSTATVVTLAMYAPTTRDVGISLIDSTGAGLFSTKQTVTVPAGQWTKFNIGMQALTGGATPSLSGICISDQSGSLAGQTGLQVDHVGFAAPAVSAPLTSVATLAPQGLYAYNASAPLTSRGALVPATTQPSSSAIDVFIDQLVNGFSANRGSWSTAFAVANPSPSYQGVNALAVDYGAAFAGLVLDRQPVSFLSDTASYLSFAVYSPNQRSLQVWLVDNSLSNLFNTKQIVTVPAGAWTKIDVPMAALTGGVSTNVVGFGIAEGDGVADQPIMYLDAVAFTAPLAAPLTSTGALVPAPTSLVPVTAPLTSTAALAGATGVTNPVSAALTGLATLLPVVTQQNTAQAPLFGRASLTVFAAGRSPGVGVQTDRFGVEPAIETQVWAAQPSLNVQRFGAAEAIE
jgi:hypothetical protein